MFFWEHLRTLFLKQMINTVFRSFRRILKPQDQLSRRIQERHEIFWTPDNAEEIRNTPARAEDSLEKWQDVENWQRKLSNKYNARQFALKMGCKVADLYWKGCNPDDIDFNSLPAQYVIRPTIGHSSVNVFIMDDGLNYFDETTYTPEQIKMAMRQALQHTPWMEFLIEEFLQEQAGSYKILNDYKFFCFNGEIASCQLINRLGPKAGFGSFYDENWTPMQAVHPGYTLVPPQPKPDCLVEMVEHVKRLSSAYKIFCRIDFYATTKGAVFGEFTPTPGMGAGYSAFGRRLLISHWDKYCTGLV